MPIYDYDGTGNTQIAKVYDYDGTANTQNGKVYDYDGTANNLIYTAECQLFPTSETGKTYTGWGYGDCAVSYDSSGYISVALSTSGVRYAVSDNTVDLTGYDYINFTVYDVSSTDGFWCNIGVSATQANTPSTHTAITSGTADTYSVDISSLSGEYYLALRGRRGEHDGSGFKISNIWLS